MPYSKQYNLSNFFVTITTLIFAITSLITVYISLSAWKNERESVRPHLTFYSSPEVYFNENNELIFSAKFSNVGRHPVDSLHIQATIVNSDLKGLPLLTDQFSLLNYIPQNCSTDIVIKIKKYSPNSDSIHIGKHYIILNLKYFDPILETNNEQIFYLKWFGIEQGKPSPVFHASKEDKERIVSYLKKT